MREPLRRITVRVDGTPIAASTTIAALGANILVLSSALPKRATTLTSCYLARSDAALAVSELASDADEECFSQREIAPTHHRATLAGACPTRARCHTMRVARPTAAPRSSRSTSTPTP